MIKTTNNEKNVEELPRFGQPFMEPPKAAALYAMKTIFKTFRKKLGLKDTILFIFRVISEKKSVKFFYTEEFNKLEEINKGMGNMVAIYVSIFRLLSDKYNREEAYNIVKEAIQDIGRYNMPLIYDIEPLLQCSGNTFENFKKLNLSAFLASEKAGVVNISLIEDQENVQRIHLDRCDGCSLGSMFGWPEIGKLGCDHDIAGYSEIEDKLGIVFRRHKTIAKGDNICDFTFYKKGFEPPLKEKMK